MKSSQQQKLSNLKSKLDNLSCNPLMNQNYNQGTLQSQLNSKKLASQNSITQYKNLSGQLSQQQNNLNYSITNIEQLQNKINQQSALKQNVELYLSDYENPTNVVEGIEKLMGELMNNIGE